MSNLAPTQTHHTQTRYTLLANALLKRFKQATGMHWQDNPLLACEWVADQRVISQWERSTWRQYKAAMIFFMTDHGPQHCVDYLQSISSDACVKKKGNGIRGASCKEKRLSRDTLEAIIDALDTTLKWDGLLVLWLMATVYTGLRPAEWQSAILTGTVLRIKNAKYTNGRANGEYRHLDISRLPANKRKIIESMIARISKVDYEKAYHGCRTRLNDICKGLWPRRKKVPSLYSARHQFRADAAINGFSLAEVAAMMGHASDETASMHYGRKAVGSKGIEMVHPHQDEVATVKATSEESQKRRAKAFNNLA